MSVEKGIFQRTELLFGKEKMNQVIWNQHLQVVICKTIQNGKWSIESEMYLIDV